MSSSPARRNAKAKNWEEEYLAMKERYLQAQTELNRRDQDARIARGHPSALKENTGASPKVAQPSTPAKVHKKDSSSSPLIQRRQPQAVVEQQPVETQPAPPNQTLFSTFARAGVAPPDPAMIWGVDEALLTMTKSNALLQVNEQLRHKLIESEQVIQALQNDVARYRRANDKIAGDFHTIQVERDHLILERETFNYKISAAESAATAAQEQARQLMNNHENVRLTLEQQSRELRSKLALSYDSNDLLSAENRRLNVELREAIASKERLLTRLSSAEANDGAQREVNSAMLLELKALNDQLAAERHRVLELSREVQSGSERQRRIDELEVLLRETLVEKHKVEQQNLQMLEDAAKHQDAAVTVAKEALKQDLDTARTTAAHWENVCRLQFRDIQIRTKQHMRVQDELMAIKAARDEADVQLIQLRGEVESARAKLDVVWPSHDSDTQGLTPSDVKSMFAARAPSHGSTTTSHAPIRLSLLSADAIEAELKLTNTAPDIVIAELRQANMSLITELETLKIANDVLSQQLRTSAATTQAQRNELSDQTAKMQKREKARLDVVDKFASRVDFLEAQVRSLRGAAVHETSFSATDLDEGETIIELHLGQLVLDCGETGVNEFWTSFPMVFATADFLVHETITTDVVATSTTAFFGTTAAYRVKQNALLMHNFSQKLLVVELHTVKSADQYATVGRGSVSLSDIIRDPALPSRRPSVSLHVNIFSTSSPTTLLANLEVTVTSRLPFSPKFIALCQAQNEVMLETNVDESMASLNSSRRAGLFAEQSSVRLSYQNQQQNPLEYLHMVKFLSIRVLDVHIDFSQPVSPLLTLWYAICDSDGPCDAWVLPPSSTPRYEFTFNVLHRHRIRNAEEALIAVRNPTPIVAFEDGELDPDVYWGVASLDLTALVESPSSTLSMALPMVNPVTGKRLATLRIEAAFELE